MYGDIGTGIADVIQARKAQKEQGFYNSLLSYGMQSGGEFDIINNKPVFIPGGDMPTKSAMWNQLLQAKGGRLSAADVQQFEAAWKQANQMKSSEQLKGLKKLSDRGYSPKQIKKTIKDSPALFENLLDLVGDLEASGDENAFAQAQVVKGMLPSRDTGGLIGEMIEEPGFMGTFGAPLALAGATGLGQYLAGTPEDMLKARSDRASELSESRKEKSNLKRKISNAEKLLNKKDSPAAKKVLTKSQESLKNLNQKIKDLKPVPRAEARYKSLMKGMPKGTTGLPAQILGYSALAQSGRLGKALGGETGESIGEDVGSLGLLGWGAMGLKGLRGAPNPYMKALGYAPLLAQGVYNLYDKYSK